MIKIKLLLIVALSIILTTNSCANQKNCRTKNKTKVDMGWM